MLKAIVQHVDRATQLAFGERAGKIAIGRDADRGARHLPGQHQRLVTGSIHAFKDAGAVGHHDDAVRGIGAAIAATENGGPLAVLNQPLRDRRNHRRLAGAAHRQVADADDRAGEMLPALGVVFDPLPASPHHLTVEGIKQGV